VAGLELTLFGGFALSFEGERLPPIPSRVSRSLLAHLVLLRQPVSRDRLVATFWPDMPEARGRRRLSHTLWQIQDALGDLPSGHRYVLARGDTLAFDVDAPHRVDVVEFERRVEPFRPGDGAPPGLRDLGRLEAALELYRGALLEGVDDPWVGPERERLAALHVDALGWMVELARGQGAYEQALVHARRLTHHDPLREDGHREVMRLCTLLGRTSEALRQYERCRSVLAEELGTEPARETQQLAELVARQRGAPVPALAAPDADRPHEDLRLVGRDRERARLVEGLDRTLTGTGGLSLVEGEAGVGASRLLRQVADDARWRGFAVAHGRCEVDGELPYLAIAEAVTPLLTPVRIAQLRPRVGDAWLAEVGRVVPRLARPTPDRDGALPADAADRMRESFLRLLTGLAGVEPLLLVVEDLHAADPETLQVLQWLAGRVTDHRLHVVVAFRGTEARSRDAVWATLRSLDTATVPDRVELGPLSAFGTAELVREVLGGEAAPALAARVHEETGGNPLFVVETVRMLRDHGGDGGDDLPLPGSIRDLVAGRVALLPATAREVLAAAAVQARAVDLDVLAAVVAAEDSPATVGDAVAELLRRGLVVDRGDGYAVRYEQVRRIVVAELDAPVRASLHGRIADALARHASDQVEDVARHLDAAGRVPEAVAAWRAAADRAIGVHAYATAREHLARALELQRSRPAAVEARIDLLRAHEDVLSVLADRDAQAAVLEELVALAGDDGPVAADVARRTAWYAAHTDDYATAEEAAARAVELAPDAVARAAALTVQGTVRCWRGDHEGSLQPLRAALDGADVVDAVRARVALGSSLRSLARFDEAAEVLADGATACAAADDPHGEARVRVALAAVHMEQGRLPDAIAGYEQALARCRAIGYRHGEGVTLVNLGNALYVDRDVLGALARYDEAAAVFAAIGNPRGRATVRMNAAVVRHELLGADRRAAADADGALAWFGRGGDARAVATCHHTLASIHRRAGDATRAAEHVDRAERAAGDDAFARGQVAQVAAGLLMDAGRPGEAVARLTRALADVREAGLDALAVRLRADRARAALAAGDEATADADSRAAVRDRAEGVERPHLVWWARHEVATALGHPDGASALARAAALLDDALAGLDESTRDRALEAVPEHAAIVAARRAAGPRRVLLRVARHDVPTGRPLLASDMREVEVELPPRAVASVGARRRTLRSVVAQVQAQGGAPTVDDLADLLEVSASTVRRDLTALRRDGTPVVTRGSRAS
jgi:DNA-binding SARP family transcriptional activator/tetratricopeptide (TPR) repeat protein